MTLNQLPVELVAAVQFSVPLPLLAIPKFWFEGLLPAVAVLKYSAFVVTLIAGDEKRYTAADAETLTEQVLGFRLPLRGLTDWVRARPATDAPAQAEYAQDGRLLTLEQHGWRIEYMAYEGIQPKRLKLVYPGLELRLAITEWK